MTAQSTWTMAIAAFLTACVPAIPPAAAAGKAPGARLVRARCGACHLPPAPDDFSPDDWGPFLADHYVPLEEGERDDVLGWLSIRPAPEAE
ncbi:MAG: hypothetical protein JRJ84_00895 [Deltaproteobacteria bacterium]|nr:hypothetical protein [Deltaproteobacteria bacterium]